MWFYDRNALNITVIEKGTYAHQSQSLNEMSESSLNIHASKQMHVCTDEKSDTCSWSHISYYFCDTYATSFSHTLWPTHAAPMVGETALIPFYISYTLGSAVSIQARCSTYQNWCLQKTVQFTELLNNMPLPMDDRALYTNTIHVDYFICYGQST